MKKEYVIILALAIGALAYYFLVVKKKSDDLETVKTPDQFEADDTTAYNGAKSLFKAGDLAWMNEIVSARYKSGNPDVMINGRASKTLALVNVAGEVNRNEEVGTFIYGGEGGKNKNLWPQSLFDTLWNSYRIPLVAKYGGV